MTTRSKKTLSAEELDEKFDRGESLEEHLDLSNAFKIVNVSMPIWMVKELDKESARLNIDRQAVIKTWIDERIKMQSGGSIFSAFSQGNELIQLLGLSRKITQEAKPEPAKKRSKKRPA